MRKGMLKDVEKNGREEKRVRAHTHKKKKKLPVSPTKLTSSNTQLSDSFKSMSSTLRMQTGILTLWGSNFKVGLRNKGINVDFTNFDQTE